MLLGVYALSYGCHWRVLSSIVCSLVRIAVYCFLMGAGWLVVAMLYWYLLCVLSSVVKILFKCKQPDDMNLKVKCSAIFHYAFCSFFYNVGKILFGILYLDYG